jgi:hypothetical protein
MGRVTFSEKKRGVLFARRLRAAAIVVLLSSIVIVAGHLPSGHDVGAHATDLGAAPAATADADYFPSHFAPPKGEPAEPIATF